MKELVLYESNSRNTLKTNIGWKSWSNMNQKAVTLYTQYMNKKVGLIIF